MTFMKKIDLITTLCFLALPLLGADSSSPAPANNGRKVEKPINYVLTKPDPLVGDWQGTGGVVDFTTNENAVRKAFENVCAAGLKTMCARPTPEALPLVEKLVKEHDIKVAIHDHGPTDLYPTGEDAWKAVQPYDKRIGLCIDVGHAWRAGGDPAAEILECHERLYPVHLKDSRGPKGTGTKDPSPVIIGHGALDIRAVPAALVEVQFQYRADFEYEERAEDQLPGLAESVGYVRGILAGMA